MTRRYSASDLETLATHGLGAKLPAPKARKKRDNEEWRIQASFFQWWAVTAKTHRIAECLFFHIPNGSILGNFASERAIRGRMLKLAGVRTGVADCFLSVPSGKFHGLYIEFKKPGGKPSAAQQEFLGFALARGYSCHICESQAMACAVTLDYLSEQP